MGLILPDLDQIQYQHNLPIMPPPLQQAWEISSLLQGWKNWSTEDQRAKKWQRFFISPKHHFYNLPSCYYGYHMTSELETAIVEANKHSICPGAFINN